MRCVSFSISAEASQLSDDMGQNMENVLLVLNTDKLKTSVFFSIRVFHSLIRSFVVTVQPIPVPFFINPIWRYHSIVAPAPSSKGVESKPSSRTALLLSTTQLLNTYGARLMG